MPKASAPIAPCVAVWLSPQTIVMPGWRQALLRPDDVDDALVDAVDREIGNAELRRHCVPACRPAASIPARRCRGCGCWSACCGRRPRSSRRAGAPCGRRASAPRRPAASSPRGSGEGRYRAGRCLRPAGAMTWLSQILSNKVRGRGHALLLTPTELRASTRRRRLPGSPVRAVASGPAAARRRARAGCRRGRARRCAPTCRGGRAGNRAWRAARRRGAPPRSR